MSLWERILQLPSVKEWCSNFLGEGLPKVFWIQCPGWAFAWSQDIAEVITSFLIREHNELPLVLQIDSHRDKEISPLVKIRQEIAVGDEVKDTESLVKHEKAPNALIIRFGPSSPILQEKWARWFARWGRLASQFNLHRQIYVIAPFPAPSQAMRRNEQFFEELYWGPPYSLIEAQALIESLGDLRTKTSFEKHWAVHLSISMCGHDVYCAREALIQATNPADLGDVKFWKQFLKRYNIEHFQQYPPGSIVNGLGIHEVHPVDLLKNHASLARRIWRGQVWWLMYCIDEIRWTAQQKLSGSQTSKTLDCKDPCKENSGELKCLVCLARGSGRLNLSRELDFVRKVRNDLAHYRPIQFIEARRLWEIFHKEPQ